MSYGITIRTVVSDEEIVDYLSKACGITRKVAKRRLDEFQKKLREATLEGKKIDITHINKLTKKGKMK